jgi:hypothetical protein
MKEHNVKHAKLVAAYASKSVSNFRELMDCFLSNEYRLAQRAAWAVSYTAKTNSELLIPYIPTLVQQLNKTGVHNAVIRNSLRVLQELEIPAEVHGELMNSCFSFIENPATPIAFKAFSLTILHRLTLLYPELKNELKLIIEDRMDEETAAFRSRGRKILKALEK